MSLICAGSSAQPLKKMTPDCVTPASGNWSSPMNSCPKITGAASATTARIRQRVTHLHITPTSNPELTLPVLCDRPEKRRSAMVLREFILRKVTSSNIGAATGLEEVRAAAARIRFSIHRTPLLPNHSLSERIGVEVRLKCENLQRAGSFKIRGALNALLQLNEEERKRGVVAFSSGNHAQGVALASRLLGIRATIVMPEGSVPTKVAATKGYGAEVVTAGVTAATRDTVAREIAEQTGASVIPPFDDERIIAGQGTVGVEIVNEWPDVRNIVVPLGGGGLLAGVALAATSMDERISIFGVEPRAG